MVEAQKTAETLQSQMSVIEDDMTHLKHREAKALKDLQQVLRVTCITRTKVQILTPEELRARRRRSCSWSARATGSRWRISVPRKAWPTPS
jgi:hypothetical protein